MNIVCPCGSGLTYEDCCGPIIAGARAKTALALMRSRYTAYATGAIEYLIQTHDPETRGVTNRERMAAWSRDTVWGGLTIVATEKGGEADDTGIVEFIARGATNGTLFEMHERSNFRRIGGNWYYVDGTFK